MVVVVPGTVRALDGTHVPTVALDGCLRFGGEEEGQLLYRTYCRYDVVTDRPCSRSNVWYCTSTRTTVQSDPVRTSQRQLGTVTLTVPYILAAVQPWSRAAVVCLYLDCIHRRK